MIMTRFCSFVSGLIISIAINITFAYADDDVLIERTFVQGLYGQVHVRVAKPAIGLEKPPLVLFHASPYSSHYFLPFMAEMAKDRIVIAMDTPGYGDSDPPPKPPSIAEYAKSAILALAHMGYDEDRPVDMLGYHTGALIASEIAITEPKSVRRLVLPGLPFLIGEARSEAYQKYVKPEMLSVDGKHLADKWSFAAYAMPAGVSLERAQEHFNDMMQCYPRCWWSYHGVFSYESEKRFPEISHPVLLISYDGSLGEETKAAKSIITHARHVHIDGVTRGAFDLAVDEIAAATREFLDAPLLEASGVIADKEQ